MLPLFTIPVQLLEEDCEFPHVLWIAQHKSVDPVLNELRHARQSGRDYGQPACHGFGHGQAERVLAAWAYINICSCIEIENIIARRFKMAPFQNIKLFCAFHEGIGIIAPNNDNVKRQCAKSAHGTENRLKSLNAPIVAEQEEHEVTFLETAA